MIYEAKTIDWRDINTKLLSNELEKLDSKVLSIYRLVNWYKETRKTNAVLSDFIGDAELKISLSDAVKLAKIVRQTSVSNLKELVTLFANVLKDNSLQEALRRVLLNQVIAKDTSIELTLFEPAFHTYIERLLIKNLDENADNTAVNQIYDLDFEQYSLWADFINRLENKPIIYHTYHGTKGEEYENVAIIMEHDFGSQNRNKFKKYFMYQQLPIEVLNKQEEFMTS